MATLRGWWPLVSTGVLVVVASLLSQLTPVGVQFQVRFALVVLVIVLALYVFIGNSGVLSFGHVSFVAAGAFSAGLLTVTPALKASTMPDLFPILADTEISPTLSLVVGAAVGGVMALVVALPLMRLSGLAAGIATFAVLAITLNVLRNWERVGPGARTITAIPRSDSLLQLTVAALVVLTIAFVYQRSRFGRRMRAAREDPYAAAATGISIYGQRVLAFTLSGVIAGFGGAQLSHLQGSMNTNQVGLDLTLVTLAMLVVGGIGSLWGAVAGTGLVSFLNSFLSEAEQGLSLVGLVELELPAGTRPLIVSGVMVLALLLRPTGLTRGQEFPWPGVLNRLGRVGSVRSRILSPGSAGLPPRADRPAAADTAQPHPLATPRAPEPELPHE
jgi:branched-chain amino acid transport system permease protein